MRRVRVTLALLAVVGAAACAGAGNVQIPQVRDEWVARIPPEQMDPIDRARAALRRNLDEEVRAEVAAEDARRELEVRKALVDSERARFAAASQRLRAAQETGDLEKIRAAAWQRSAAIARHRLAEQRVALGEAEVRAARARRELEAARTLRARLELERTEYEVLRGTGDTRSGRFSAQQFDRAESELAREERELSGRLAQRQGEVAAREEQVRRMEGRMGAGGAGPGR